MKKNQKLCNTFSNFFLSKINLIKTTISTRLIILNSPTSAPDTPFNGAPLLSFPLCTPAEVGKLLTSSSSKSSRQDYIPTSLLKSCSSIFSELIATLANLSMNQGTFPSCFKLAQVTPLLKKAGLDKDTPSNYRPISNLNNISKLLERLILARIQDHVTTSPNFNPFQSAYRRFHSTETALLLTLDRIYHSIDQGFSTVLVSLDLSAAFDTIDHPTLLNRLSTSYGVHGAVLSWFKSYLSNRSQFVLIENSKSSISPSPIGVPQGSVLGPILFSIYISPISEIVSAHGLSQQQYADDTQLYVAVNKLNLQVNIQKLELCLLSLHTWFCLNGLALNPDKSDTIVFGTAQRAHTLPRLTSINVAGVTVPISSEVKILGVTLDTTLSLNKHVASINKSCYFHLRALRHIRNALTDDSAKSIACALVSSRLDYANSVLIGTTASNIMKLQRVQNAMARIVTRQHGHRGTTQSFANLHWLPIMSRIDFKVATIVFKILTTSQPSYLADLISPLVSRRPGLRSNEPGTLSVPRTKLVIGDRAFRSAAPSIWNRLPADIRTSRSSLTFRKQLKTHYYHLAFD